jgi:hypothetical protein
MLLNMLLNARTRVLAEQSGKLAIAARAGCRGLQGRRCEAHDHKGPAQLVAGEHKGLMALASRGRPSSCDAAMAMAWKQVAGVARFQSADPGG